VAITPDTKDWTWVLERPCDDCGFDSGDYSREDIPAVIRSNALEWTGQLERGEVKDRPSPQKWSVLEYGCHVRDVYRIFDERLSLMLTRDNPVFANWDQDETAVNDHYDLQDPTNVSSELVTSADALAQRIDAIVDDQWARRGTRSNGSEFSVESLSIYMLHDSCHHLWDVTLA
jgi:hypothetical protein